MADLGSSSQSSCEGCPGPHYCGRSGSSCRSLRSFICCPEVRLWREECLRPQLPVAHRDPPALQGQELARLPCMAVIYQNMSTGLVPILYCDRQKAL